MSTPSVVEHSSQAVLISARFLKRHQVWHCPNGRWHSSDWAIPDAFHQMMPLISSTGNSTCLKSMSDFVVAHKFSSNPTRYTTSPSSSTDWLLEWLVVDHFIFYTTFSVPHCCKRSIFLCLWMFISKMNFVFIAFEQTIADGNVVH